MATSGSILGNAVRRLEDPDAVDRRREVRRRPRRAEHGRTSRSCDRPSRTPTCASVDVERRVVDARRASRCTTRGGDDLGLPSLQQFPMMPRDVEPAGVRHGHGAIRRRHRRRRRRRDHARRRSTPPSASSSTTTRCRRSRTPLDALAPDAPLLFPEHGSNVCFGTDVPGEGDADPLDGADAVAEVTMVSQRLAGVPMETNGILAVPAPTAGSRAGSRTRRRTRSTPRTPPMLGLEPDAAARRVPVGRRRLRPEGGAVRRAPRRRRGRAEARTPGEVDRDPLRGHGLARPRPRLRDDGQARRAAPTARSSASTPRSSRRPARTRRSARSCRCSRR